MKPHLQDLFCVVTNFESIVNSEAANPHGGVAAHEDRGGPSAFGGDFEIHKKVFQFFVSCHAKGDESISGLHVSHDQGVPKLVRIQIYGPGRVRWIERAILFHFHQGQAFPDLLQRKGPGPLQNMVEGDGLLLATASED